MSTPQDKVRATLEALGIKAPGGEGWEALDPTSAANAKAQTALERYERAKVIADGISDEALAELQRLTRDSATFDVPNLGLVNAIGFGIWREGQNALVRWIETQKTIAAQGPGGDVPTKPKRRRN